MTDTLEQARKVLKQRIAEIDDERGRLERALAELGSGSSGTRRSGRTSAAKPRGRSRSRSTGKRAPRGQREDQLLSSIRSNPDYRVSQHAREIGVSAQQLYPLLRRLSDKSLISKANGRYRATAKS